MSNPSITADKTPWYQWDTGLTVTVSGGEMTECHFANRKQGTAYVQAVINGVARVPDELLQVAAPIKAYGFAYDDAGGKTYVDQSFEVIARNIPSDYTYTKTIQKTIRDAEAARDEAVQAAKDTKASELAAEDSAVEASDSASEAATSASNAEKSAGEAAKSASDAKAAADKTVEDASELLKTYTDNAKTSADNASASASNAADAASAASGSASAASDSASNAATSASESATSAQEAKTAAGNAASEVLAATKANADAAAQSAADAATAKAGAEAAKGEAAASASNAAASAENAANSARAAANSVNSVNVISPKTVDVSASSSDQFDIAIGQNAKTTANQSIAIGVSSEASHLSSIALGCFATTSKDYEVAIGTLLENGVDVTREITHVSTPTGPNSASTKKYTDDNDSKTLSEAKKYTDDNTSNALVGTVSGKLLHVEDAWPGKPLSLTIDGAYKQDGTPSPETPVPIESVSELRLVSTGKNLLDYQSWKEYIQTSGVIHGTFEFGNDGTIAITATEDDAYTSYSVEQFPRIGVYPGQVYTLSWSADNDSQGNIFVFFNGVELNNVYANNANSKKLTFTTPSDCRFITFRFGVFDSGVTINYSNIQIEQGSTATDYSPYVAGSTTSNLLVSEDGTSYEIRSLPDGTRDELVVKDGRRIVEKSLNKIVVDGTTHLCVDVLNGNQAIINVETAPEKTNEGESKVICDKLQTISANDSFSGVKNGIASCAEKAYPANSGGTINIHLDGISTVEDMNEWLQKNPLTVIYELYENEKETIDIGQADQIVLPETISNVWTDAELTTNMSMTYKRDINIAFDNLVQAVVAAAAGE